MEKAIIWFPYSILSPAKSKTFVIVTLSPLPSSSVTDALSWLDDDVSSSNVVEFAAGMIFFSSKIELIMLRGASTGLLSVFVEPFPMLSKIEEKMLVGFFFGTVETFFTVLEFFEAIDQLPRPDPTGLGFEAAATGLTSFLKSEKNIETC